MRALVLATTLALSSSLSARVGCGVLANSVSSLQQQQTLEQLQRDLAATRAELAREAAYLRDERAAGDQYKQWSEARVSTLERRVADLEAALDRARAP